MKVTNLRSLLLALTGSVLCTAGLIQAQGATDSQQSSTSPPRVERFGRLAGAKVNDAQGQAIGHMQDIVVDTATGNVNLAVISLEGLGRPTQYTAVPWQLLRQTGPTTFTLNTDRNTLATASTFTTDTWPNFSNSTYTAQVYSHYGLNAPTAVGAPASTPAGVHTGTGYYPASERWLWALPQPDGKMVFPEMVYHNRP